MFNYFCWFNAIMQAVLKEKQAQEEIGRLQEALSKLVDEAGARTRQEVTIRCLCSPDHKLIYLYYCGVLVGPVVAHWIRNSTGPSPDSSPIADT